MSVLILDGIHDYLLEATPDPKFRLSEFTWECWVRVGELGSSNPTTDNPQPYPILYRGANYKFGIDKLTMHLAAQYQDVTAVTRRLLGQRTLDRHTWYHVAVTRNATHLRLYVNGQIDGLLGCPAPDATGTSALSIGTDWYGSSANGAFSGAISNVRCWSVALTPSQIRARAGTSGSMAIASNNVDEIPLDLSRFETSGSVVISASVPGYTALPAELHNAASGLDFTHTGIATIEAELPPFQCDEPGTLTLTSPADLSTPTGPAVTLSASIVDGDYNANTVEFWGRNWKSHAPFMIATLPDTQVPVSAGDTNVLDGFQWFVDVHASLGIKAVVSLGDCVNVAGSVTEWDRYSRGVALIEAVDLPYCWCVGNHDRETLGTSTVGNTYFGPARFEGRPYYLGHFGTSNNNSAIRVLVASDPTDLYVTVISLEYDALSVPGVLDWAYSIAEQYPNDIVLVVSHFLLTMLQPGFKSPLCEALHTLFADLPQVRLFASGHLAQSHRKDVLGGVTRYTIMADYQFNTGSNRFYGRLFEFTPRNATLRNTTRDMTLDAYRVETQSEFTLPFELPGYPAFTKLGEVTGVAAGATATFEWSGLTTGQHYEWFARARNGNVYRDSERRGFEVT